MKEERLFKARTSHNHPEASEETEIEPVIIEERII